MNTAYASRGPRYRIRKPSYVSQVIDRGTNGFLGLLPESPDQILKYCIPENEEAVFSLERERRSLDILGDHQYIIKLYEASDRGLLFEYYPLRSLRRYYESLGGMLPPFPQRLQWCHEAIVAISYVHSKNIIHNDLSARNLLLTSEMSIKLCDFGSSTFSGEKIHGFNEFRYVGLRRPDGKVSTFKDDIFSVGGLFFEIMSGKPPYSELERSEVVQKYENNIFPSLEGFDPHYAGIIYNCWNGRYPSIQNLADDLSPLANLV